MLQLQFPEFPLLTTERLLLRPLTLADASEIHQLRADPVINALVGRATSTGIADAEAHIKRINGLIADNKSFYWAICFKNSPGLIGTICFWNFDEGKEQVEIGYELLPAFQGKGVIAESIEKVIEFGFASVKAKAITAFPSADNPSSVRVLEKAGFKISNDAIDNVHGDGDKFLCYILENKSS